MTATNPMLNPAWVGSILLGRFSAWLGSFLVPVYLAIFVLAATHSAAERPVLAGLTLSMVLPTAGLALGVLGAGLARIGSRPVPLSCIVGLVLHAVALALAALLPFVAPLS